MTERKTKAEGCFHYALLEGNSTQMPVPAMKKPSADGRGLQVELTLNKVTLL
jgi:hypothetical protein